MKFTFSMRKKTVKDYPLTERLDTLFKDSVILSLPEEHGIITASNWKHFPGLQLLLYSLKKQYDTPITVFDVGMTKDQLKWIDAIPGVTVAPKLESPIDTIFYWEAWVKPFYVRHSPYKKTIWIDCDTIVTGELIEIVEACKDEPLFTADHTGVNEGTYNTDELYRLKPIEGIEKDGGAYLNTGVFILDIERDAALVDQWCEIVVEAGANPEIAKAIMCWDQGACKWVLQKMDLTHTINKTKVFNYPARSRQCPFPPSIVAFNAFLNTIKESINDKVVVSHWMGSPKPWVNWSEILPISIV